MKFLMDGGGLQHKPTFGSLKSWRVACGLYLVLVSSVFQKPKHGEISHWNSPVSPFLSPSSNASSSDIYGTPKAFANLDNKFLKYQMPPVPTTYDKHMKKLPYVHMSVSVFYWRVLGDKICFSKLTQRQNTPTGIVRIPGKRIPTLYLLFPQLQCIVID